MGGKNHQPCHIYLAESTRLSRFLSLAYAELELGNVALEDVILAELNGQNGDTSVISKHLNFSMQSLTGATKMIGKIRQKMDEKDFADLPTLRKLNLRELGESLAGNGLVDSTSWKIISEKMIKGGFCEVLVLFESLIESLSVKTSSLMTMIATLEGAVKKGEVSRILEENRPGNIKDDFAILFVAWAKFNQLFLASSVLSTELWYAFNGYGSLVGREAQLMAV
ncbi:MAG: hypothetical protein A2Y98_01180 [Candidatus Portnoybacteria bacterium RBG_19FT_COMBO_36_7]|uniref:Uncharacterized protein n=1 Tax=Candidatus Portnoybacteria bacterium RBG_19FT_COMBO_36_7 TaxID=1801992 RepID=A0A1G2F665_9BACT|nr:MAG: hypothetical protein A2Y98_01180 [Candidatus Portnoybacteria bacterium RBG_19FT_COMBO_36_7]